MAVFPAFFAGQRLTATLMAQIPPNVVVKQNNETRTTTTTYADDGELNTIALGVGTWEIIADLAMVGGAGGIAIKTQWSFTGTWNNPLRLALGATAANVTAGSGPLSWQGSAYATNADCIYGLSTSGVYTLAREMSRQIVVTVAGNMALKWAPNVSSATSGGIRQSSSISARQIA
jgi:hypothetical protein